jgi:hypothetical protein
MTASDSLPRLQPGRQAVRSMESGRCRPGTYYRNRSQQGAGDRHILSGATTIESTNQYKLARFVHEAMSQHPPVRERLPFYPPAYYLDMARSLKTMIEGLPTDA